MNDIATWLSDLKLSIWLPIFKEQEIDAEAVRDLTEDDLRELGIPMGPRKKLLRAIGELISQERGDTGESLQTDRENARGAVRGQQRQVTILFADISGFTALSSRLDAEEVHALLEVYFAKTDEIVRLHGGTVDKHIGDSVMAIFGAKVAYGNEAERALQAALSIHAAMPDVTRMAGHTLSAHIGLASGQVVVDSLGSDEKYTVIGESVNLASRLTDAAGAGETIVSDKVRTSLPASVALSDPRDLELKGFDRPVRSYVVMPGTIAQGPAIPKTPLVGRSKEISQFGIALEECRTEDRGQFVLLRGEAGIGKTRLALAFSGLAKAGGFDVHRVLVLDFGAALGQDAVSALVRSLLGLTPHSDQSDNRRAVGAAVEAGLIESAAVVHLNSILGLPQSEDLRAVHDAMNGDVRRQGQRDAVTSVIRNTARRKPNLILVEDVHWADDATLETIAAIARSSVDVPVILVATTRFDSDPTLKLQRSGLGSIVLTMMDIQSLRPEEARQLASGMTDIDRDLIDFCVERSQGNPLFLEQLLRNVPHSTGDAVPDTVQSLVQSSLDVLESVDREALQVASAMGQRFSLDDVREVTNRQNYDPSELIVRHLVQQDGPNYLFSHALVRDAVYSSILPSRCRTVHRQIAAVIGGSDLPLRARHLELAHDPEAALAYLVAARSAASSNAEELVLTLCERGERLVNETEVQVEFIRLKGEALLVLGKTEASIAAFQAALSDSDAEQDKCMALIGIAEGLRSANRYEEATAVLKNAGKYAEVMPDRTKARIHYLQGCVCFPLGDVDGCLKNHEEALHYARLAEDAAGEASALSGLGDAYYLQGLMKDAYQRFAECVAICRSKNLGRIEVANRHMMGWSRIHLMEFREALEDALAIADLASRVGNLRAAVLAHMLTSYTGFKLGDYDRAGAGAQAAANLAGEIGAKVFIMQSLALRAQVLRDTGKAGEALALAREAVRGLGDTGQSFIGPFVLAVAASLEEEKADRVALLTRAEAILDQGCVSHNYMWFTDIAIDVARKDEDWGALTRYATRLRNYTLKQPLKFSDFLIAKAEALSAMGRGERGWEEWEELI